MRTAIIAKATAEIDQADGTVLSGRTSRGEEDLAESWELPSGPAAFLDTVLLNNSSPAGPRN